MSIKLKYSALFLACSLVLTGCGGSGSDGSNNGGNPGNGSPVVSDQDKAKAFVDTVNTMISGVQNIDETYQRATNLTDNVASLGETTAIVQAAIALMIEDSAGSNKNYSTAQINALLQADGYVLTNSTLTGSINANTLALSGSFNYKPLKEWTWSQANGQWQPVYGEEITAQVNNLKANLSLTNNDKTLSLNLAQDSKISAKTPNTTNATLEAGSGTTLTVVFDQPLDLNQPEASNTVNNAQFSFKNILLNIGGTAQDSIGVEEFSATAQAATLKAGQDTFVQTIPTSLKLIGKVKSGDNLDEAAVNLSIKLNNDLSKPIVLDEEGGETSAGFANVEINLSLSAKVRTGDVLKTTLAAKRAELSKGEITKLELELNGKKLTGQAWIDLPVNDQPGKMKAMLADPQGASITVNDVEQFTTTDIMVNGKSWGTITKQSNGMYVARFNDNTVKTIAP